jgi:hypothetical protein
MLRVIVRCKRNVLHFVGEVTEYNLENLDLHVSDTLKRHGPTGMGVDVEIDATDIVPWYRCGRPWLARLEQAGVPVRVETQ